MNVVIRHRPESKEDDHPSVAGGGLDDLIKSANWLGKWVAALGCALTAAAAAGLGDWNLEIVAYGLLASVILGVLAACLLGAKRMLVFERIWKWQERWLSARYGWAWEDREYSKSLQEDTANAEADLPNNAANDWARRVERAVYHILYRHYAEDKSIARTALVNKLQLMEKRDWDLAKKQLVSAGLAEKNKHGLRDGLKYREAVSQYRQWLAKCTTHEMVEGWPVPMAPGV